MPKVVFQGPHARLVIGQKVLERGGPAVDLTREELAVIENASPRWRYDVLDGGTKAAAPKADAEKVEG